MLLLAALTCTVVLSAVVLWVATEYAEHTMRAQFMHHVRNTMWSLASQAFMQVDAQNMVGAKSVMSLALTGIVMSSRYLSLPGC